MPAKLVISFRWQGRPLPGVTAYLRRLACQVLREAAVTQGEVAVLLCDDLTIQLLNRRFRKKNKPTDVLSFPAQEALPEGLVHLGDVAISLQTAARQAASAGHSLERELALLLIHGLLHLLGYDHETDNGEMEAKEKQLREKLL